MYLVKEAAKIEKVDRAMASLVENPNKKMQKGIMMPPPPMPAALAMARRVGRSRIPINSLIVIGKMSLCSQMPASLQISKGCLEQFSSYWQVSHEARAMSKVQKRTALRIMYLRWNKIKNINKIPLICGLY